DLSLTGSQIGSARSRLSSGSGGGRDSARSRGGGSGWRGSGGGSQSDLSNGARKQAGGGGGKSTVSKASSKASSAASHSCFLPPQGLPDSARSDATVSAVSAANSTYRQTPRIRQRLLPEKQQQQQKQQQQKKQTKQPQQQQQRPPELDMYLDLNQLDSDNDGADAEAKQALDLVASGGGQQQQQQQLRDWDEIRVASSGELGEEDGDDDQRMFHGDKRDNNEDEEATVSPLAVSDSARQNVEAYVAKVSAATRIQRWWRRHRRRRAACQAALRRLATESKARLSSLGPELPTSAEQAEAVRAKREAAASQDRQRAVRELRARREEKRAAEAADAKRVAEAEVDKLDRAGLIRKSKVSASGQGRLQTPKERRESSKAAVAQSPSPTPRSEQKQQKSGGSSSSKKQQQQPEPEDDAAASPVAGDAVSDLDTATLVSAVSRRTAGSGSSKAQDIFSTLKALEEPPDSGAGRSGSGVGGKPRSAWVDDIDKLLSAEAPQTGGSLTADRLAALDSSGNSSKSAAAGKRMNSWLTGVQLQQHQPQQSPQQSSRQEQSGGGGGGGGGFVETPRAEAISKQLDAAMEAATSQVLSQQLALDEKNRTVESLQRALQQQRELTVRHVRETERQLTKQLEMQRSEYEATVQRNYTLIDQLIDEKKVLQEKCESMLQELKTLRKQADDKLRHAEDRHAAELTRVKELHAAAEKLRREKWEAEKTKKIKELTVKGLEPEIQAMVARHKQEIQRLRAQHEADLLAADERAGQRYVRLTEELRDQLAQEKDAACAREREAARQRYESQLEAETQALEAQRKRMYAEVQEEKDRLADTAARQRQELDRLRAELADTHSRSADTMKSEFAQAREEQDRRHEQEMRALREALAAEKQAFEQNLLKRQESTLVQRERELKEQLRRERDKEIELVLQRLEADTSSAKEEAERSAASRVARLKEKFAGEVAELERSERQALEKYNQIKARNLEVEGELERLKVLMKQKEVEIDDIRALYDKLNRERKQVSEVVRQEFADRLVSVEEENKRLKAEASETRARCAQDVERARAETQEAKRASEEEMEEIHRRVKEAIRKKEDVVNELRQQYQTAVKRAEHLEQLLEQQRQQLLSLGAKNPAGGAKDKR
ncbi:hypothetical protein BOX15_Mlig032023g27, partial [Macrostomum lignano]